MNPRLPPSCVAKYRVLRPLARGGFGQVLLARHRDLRRPVALKLLVPGAVDDPLQVRRFLDEARISAALSHPNIVVILDHGVDGGVPWIAYEYLDGGSLREHLSRGPLELEQALECGAQVASALEEAHQRGILHRDIKPENILLAGPGLWKVTDFGIAKWSGAGAVKTEAGLILGTPRYLAPELLQGASASARSDLYSLGVMLHEALAGRPPFDSDDVAELLRAQVDEQPPPLRTLVPEVPRELEAAVLKALAKLPEERFSSAAEMARVLAVRGGTGEPRRGRPGPPTVRAASPGTGRAGPEAEPPGPTKARPSPQGKASDSPLTLAADRADPLPALPRRGGAGVGEAVVRRRRLAAVAVGVLLTTGFAVGLWGRLGRDRSPTATRAPLRLAALDLTGYRRLAVRVSGHVTGPVDVRVRGEQGWDSIRRIEPPATTALFERMPPSADCEVSLLDAGHRLLAPKATVRTPRLVAALDLVLLPTDTQLLVYFVPEPRAPVRVDIDSKDAMTPVTTLRLEPGMSGACRAVVKGLSPDTSYVVRGVSERDWVALLPQAVRTEPSDHGRQLDNLLAATAWDRMALELLMPHLEMTPDPRAVPLLGRLLKRPDASTMSALGKINRLALRLRDPELGAALFGLISRIEDRRLRLEVLDTATAVGLPRARELARQSLNEVTEVGEALSYAGMIARERTAGACDTIAERWDRLLERQYGATLPESLLFADRARARRHFERWAGDEARPSNEFRLKTGLRGLALLGDDAAAARLSQVALRHPEPRDRVQAMEYLSWSCPPSSRQHLVKVVLAFTDDQKNEWAAVRGRVRELAPRLRSLFDQRHSDSDKLHALLPLAALGERHDAALFAPLLAHARDELAGVAALAIGRLGDPTVAPALVDRVERGRDPTGLVTLALGTLRYGPAVPVLARRLPALLGDGQPRAAVAAWATLCALGLIGGPPAQKALTAAVGGLGSRPELKPLVTMLRSLEEVRRSGGSIFVLTPWDAYLGTGIRLELGDVCELASAGLVSHGGAPGRFLHDGWPVTFPPPFPGVGVGPTAHLGDRIEAIGRSGTSLTADRTGELVLSPYAHQGPLPFDGLRFEQLVGAWLVTVKR